MSGAGRDANCISFFDIESISADSHDARSGQDVIDFFAVEMLMKMGSCALGDDRFGKTLVPIQVNERMHELADDRAILCDIRLDLFVFTFLYHCNPVYLSGKDIQPARYRLPKG